MGLLLQLVVSGIALGCIYILETLGFALIFGVSRVFHLAHGAVFLLAAYAAYAAVHYAGWGLLPASAVAFVTCAATGAVMYRWVYQPILQRGRNAMVPLIASIGMLILFSNFFTAAFGSTGLSLADVSVIRQSYHWGPISIAPMRIGIAVAAAVLTAALLLFLRYTRLGRTMRAVASNPAMAEVIGLSVNRVMLWTYIIGSVITVPAGVLIGLDSGFAPSMGFEAVLIAAIAVIVGGIGSIPGAALACIVLGVAQSVAVWKISADWQSAIAFGILAVFIVLRPQGFFGQKLWKARV